MVKNVYRISIERVVQDKDFMEQTQLPVVTTFTVFSNPLELESFFGILNNFFTHYGKENKKQGEGIHVEKKTRPQEGETTKAKEQKI